MYSLAYVITFILLAFVTGSVIGFYSGYSIHRLKTTFGSTDKSPVMSKPIPVPPKPKATNPPKLVNPLAKYFKINDVLPHGYWQGEYTFQGCCKVILDSGRRSEAVLGVAQRLYNQSRRVNTLFEELEKLLPKLALSNPRYPYTVAQKCFDAYEQNCQEALILIDKIMSVGLPKNRNEAQAELYELVQDNYKIISVLESFIATAHNYLAKLYRDTTPLHLTDFTSLHELERLRDVIQRAIDAAECAQAESAEVSETAQPAATEVAQAQTATLP